MKRASFLLLCAAALSSATTLNYGQCAGTDTGCAALDVQNGLNPGQLLATGDAQVINNDGGLNQPVGTIHSAVFQSSGGGLEFFYQLSLAGNFPVGAQSFNVTAMEQQEFIGQPINVFGRSDSLTAYGAANFTASSIISTSIKNSGLDRFSMLAAFPLDNPLAPSQTSAVLGITSDFWRAYNSNSLGATLTVPLGDGFGGHDYLVQGNLLVGAAAPEPGTFLILSLGLGLVSIGGIAARRRRYARI